MRKMRTTDTHTTDIVAHGNSDSDDPAIPVAALVVLITGLADGALTVLWNNVVEQIYRIFKLLKQTVSYVADKRQSSLKVALGASSSVSTSGVTVPDWVGPGAVATSGFLLRFAASGLRRVCGFDDAPPRAGTVFEESKSPI